MKINNFTLTDNIYIAVFRKVVFIMKCDITQNIKMLPNQFPYRFMTLRGSDNPQKNHFTCV